MTYLGNSDYYLEVARGREGNTGLVHKFGRNPDIDTGSGFEAIWNGGGDYTGFDSTGAELIELTSSSGDDTGAGSGAQTVQIYGLDANWLEQNETITMAGASAASSVNTYIRMNRMIVRSAGAGGQNAGAITADQATSGDIHAVMPAGYNQTMICAYTIPAGKTGYLLAWFAGLSGKTNADCNVRIKMRPSGETFQVKEEQSIQGAGSSSFTRTYTAPKGPITAKTDVFVEADSDTNSTAVSAGFDLILVETD